MIRDCIKKAIWFPMLRLVGITRGGIEPSKLSLRVNPKFKVNVMKYA